MNKYSRTDRLGGMPTVCSYFGGYGYHDAPICLGECAVGKYYLEVPGEGTFYQQRNGSWSQVEFDMIAARSYPSFLDLLSALSIELFMESGEKVTDASQARTPICQVMLDKLLKVGTAEIPSFDNFNAWRHG